MPTLDGAPVKLRLKAGTQGGSRHRVQAQGHRDAKRAHGDLIVTVDVQVPTSSATEQRQAVEAFAAATTASPRAGLFDAADR